MWATDSQRSNALCFGSKILGAIGDEPLRAMPLGTVSFEPDALLNEQIEVSRTPYIDLGAYPQPSADQTHTRMSFVARLRASIDLGKQRPEPCR